MVGSIEFANAYSPTSEESSALLAEVVKWIKELKKLNLSTELAAALAKDFLQPVCFATEGQSEEPGEFTDAVSQAPYLEVEEDDSED